MNNEELTELCKPSASGIY